MMKRILTVFVLILAASLGVRLDAQIVMSWDMFRGTSFSVMAQVLDSLTKEPITFASAYLRHPKDTVITSFALTDTLGKRHSRTSPKANTFFALNILATSLSIRRSMSATTTTPRSS